MDTKSFTSEVQTAARVFPDGGFVIFRRKKGGKAKGEERRNDRVAYGALPSVQGSLFGSACGELAAVVDCRMRGLLGVSRSDSERGAAPLDLTERLNSSENLKTRAPRGISGLTPHGRRLIFNSIDYLEKRYGKDQLSFLTLTLPGMSDSELAAIQQNWAEITEEVLKSLTSRLKSKGLPGEVVGCTEIQPNRKLRTGQEVPHLHLVFVGRHRKGAWATTPKKIRNTWKRQCKKYIKSNVNWNASVDLKRVVKSASRYLSKYLSKGRTTAGSSPSTGEVCSFVSCWYVASLSLRRRFRRSVNTLSGLAQLLESLIRENLGVVQVYHKYIRMADGRDLWVATTGTLPYSWRSWFCIPMISISDSLVS